MIIGPNGTGKSSIACAIALGLNWPPSVRYLRPPRFISAHLANKKDSRLCSRTELLCQDWSYGWLHRNRTQRQDWKEESRCPQKLELYIKGLYLQS